MGPRIDFVARADQSLQTDLDMPDLEPTCPLGTRAFDADGFMVGYGPTPLQADLRSRQQGHVESTGCSEDPSTQGLITERLILSGPKGKYTVELKLPQQYFSMEQFQKILHVITVLNSYAAKPVTTFLWDDCGGNYDESSHFVHLPNQQYMETNALDFETALHTLAHEMGHAIFTSGHFDDDPQMRTLFYLSLGWKNYEVIEDSNYDFVPNGHGHPTSAWTELFASTIAAYFLHSEQLQRYILHPHTPPEMKEFGRLIWCFAREKVFRGKLFTADMQDPFAHDSFQQLLTAMESRQVRALVSALEDSTSSLDSARTWGIIYLADVAATEWGEEVLTAVQESMDSPNDQLRSNATMAMGNLGYTFGARAVGPLRLALQDPSRKVQQKAVWGLGSVGRAASIALPEIIPLLASPEANIRAGAVYAVGEIGLITNQVKASIENLLQDPDGLVRYEARVVLNKLATVPLF